MAGWRDVAGNYCIRAQPSPCLVWALKSNVDNTSSAWKPFYVARGSKMKVYALCMLRGTMAQHGNHNCEMSASNLCQGLHARPSTRIKWYQKKQILRPTNSPSRDDGFVLRAFGMYRVREDRLLLLIWRLWLSCWITHVCFLYVQRPRLHGCFVMQGAR